MLYSGQAIVLKRKIIKEDDYIVTILSKDYGKIDLVVKAGAKLNSKLASPLSGIYCIEFTAAKGHELDKIIFSTIIERFKNCENILDNRLGAIQITEIIDKLISGALADIAIYNQTLEALRALEKINNKFAVQFLVHRFLWSLFYKLGLGPETRFCVRCQNTDTLSAFSLSQGGMLCSACRLTDTNAKIISTSSLPIFSSSKLTNQKTLSKDIISFITISHLWSKFHLTKPLLSLSI